MMMVTVNIRHQRPSTYVRWRQEVYLELGFRISSEEECVIDEGAQVKHA